MTTETFPDGSTIETDEATGNRTVCGKLAHDEYLKRLTAEIKAGDWGFRDGEKYPYPSCS